jgi:hypothetical protein
MQAFSPVSFSSPSTARYLLKKQWFAKVLEIPLPLNFRQITRFQRTPANLELGHLWLEFP